MLGRFFSKVLLHLPPEIAHACVINAIRYGLYRKDFTYESDILKSSHFGMDFQNPLGLAAGFDKNGTCLLPLSKMGFGFIELGTVTLRPQSGNAKPRIFRLPEDESVINRLGFNNVGVDAFIKNIASKYPRRDSIVGVNIGKNFNSNNAVRDYTSLLRKVYDYSDYIVLNISSPNTPNLRKLQHYGAFIELITSMLETRREIDPKEKVPILVKISPDLDETERIGIANVINQHKIAGIIISNTTISRQGLISKNRVEYGGLSGSALFSYSTRLLHDMYYETRGRIPIIGCGGISNAHDAYLKIRQGASLFQLYTSIVYKGFCNIWKINKDLATILKADGFSNITEAIGIDVDI